MTSPSNSEFLANASNNFSLQKSIVLEEQRRLRFSPARLAKSPTTASGATRSAGSWIGHHDDYSKPLDFVYLCKRCHMKADMAMRRRSEKFSTRIVVANDHPLAMARCAAGLAQQDLAIALRRPISSTRVLEQDGVDPKLSALVGLSTVLRIPLGTVVSWYVPQSVEVAS